MGRPSTYNEEIADTICEAIANGGALYLMCQERPDFPGEKTIYQWLERHPAFAQKYARARERQADRRVEEMIVIADTCEDANKARLQIDARKWHASKLYPKRYSEKNVVEHSGPDGGPIEVSTDWSKLSTEEREAVRQALAKVAGAQGG